MAEIAQTFNVTPMTIYRNIRTDQPGNAQTMAASSAGSGDSR